MTLPDDLAVERRALVTRLRALPAPAWEQPSLCAGWTTRHVLAHLVTPFLVPPPRFLLLAARARSLDGAMDRAARSLAARPVVELLDRLEAEAGSAFRPPGMPYESPFIDVVAHGADIAWALDEDRSDPGDPVRLRTSLDFLHGRRAQLAFVPRGRLDGVRLVADDQDWARGEGAVVEGSSLALLMAALGRPASRTALRGPGVDVLLAAA